MNCPSCKIDFIEKRNTAFLCKNCGWLTQVDNKWITCPEPAKITEPEPKPEPKPEPDPEKKTDKKEKENVRSYFGGLFTITQKVGIPD